MLTGGVVGAVILTIVWLARQGAMKNRLSGFDDGTLCIGCHSRNMSVTDGKARCGSCGHVADLAAMQAAVVTDQQIADATRPDRRRF